MHITYEIRKFMTDIDLNNSKYAGRSHVEIIEQLVTDLKTEETTIMKVCSKLTQFLRVNSLSPINDDIFEYLNICLREEQNKKSNGALNDQVILGLEQLLSEYQHEKNRMDESIKNDPGALSITTSNGNNSLQLEEVYKLITSLYDLPINGRKIRLQVERLQDAQQSFTQNREKTVDLPPQSASSSVMSALNIITSQA